MPKREPEQVDPMGNNVQLDEAVMAIMVTDLEVIPELPPDSLILSVTPAGKSQWVATVKITVQLYGGQIVEYFKKGATGKAGEGMVKGTMEAEQALYTFLSNRVPKPVAYRKYASRPDTHFYLCQFVEMNDQVPSPQDWAAAVSDLHINSMGKSPTKQFGFHVPTHLANIPINNTWNSSWSAFWAQQMKSMFEIEEHVYGPDHELEALKLAFINKAIPRYLGPLESEGRSVEPCLIHSDLWPGNIKPRTSSGELCMFDACAYWGHNEGNFQCAIHPCDRVLTFAL
ncbi:hypothetical protein N7466_009084 [Penicillium verhagenii]|uniref:uncharacterized protein n=1 Tax=Penicillium verhagenii TaxID=1562060 RepID=UPI002545737C|nr:uncharacterized protein N7466_009084 [Penicillium verhagenii]KAJ5920758.1 hypothetical protein N7466_009084 [Penicillium verhagenii]